MASVREVWARPRAAPSRRRWVPWVLAAGLLLLPAPGASAAQASIMARNEPDGRCVVSASLPGAGPWQLRLELRRAGRWVRAGKPLAWSAETARFACANELRARIRVRVLGAELHTPTIRQPVPISPQVRMVYARPRDRPARAEFAAAVPAAARSVQQWYREQVGRTFRLSPRGLERCVLPQPASRYQRHTYDRVLEDLRACLPVSIASPAYTWLIYADIDHGCGAPGTRLGMGVRGIAIMPRQDLDGLAGLTAQDDCGRPVSGPYERWVGGMAHELGHAFGLAHPRACERRRPGCPERSLMWLGYADFPGTFLTSAERGSLQRSPFFS